MSGSLFFVSVIAVVAGGFLYLGWFKDWRPAAHRVPAVFRVSSDNIESRGRSFNKSDVHRLIIRNGVTEGELGSTYAVATNGVAAGMVMAGHAMGKSISRR